MINKVTIKYLYRHTRKPKDGFKESLLEEVAECCKEHFDVAFSNGFMEVRALEADNPFRRIRLNNIQGFKIVGNEVAVVMVRSILFFDNATGAVKINFRCSEPSLWQKFCEWLCPCHHQHRRACVE